MSRGEMKVSKMKSPKTSVSTVSDGLGEIIHEAT